MATIKSYTDIEQSKILAEILPIKSADMCYVIDYAESNKYGTDHFKLEVDTYGLEAQKRDNIPCWSLTALLDILPNENMLVKTTDGEYYCLAKDIMTKHYNNPIDACVEMIIKLHELNLL